MSHETPRSALDDLVLTAKHYLGPDWGVPATPEHQRTFLIAAIHHLAGSRDSFRAAWEAASPPAAETGQWQPIETAPNDGTLMWLCRSGDDYEPSLGWWAEAVPSDEDCEYDNGMDAGWFSQGGFWPGGDQPTHWMPLPEPPLRVSGQPVGEGTT